MKSVHSVLLVAVCFLVAQGALAQNMSASSNSTASTSNSTASIADKIYATLGEAFAEYPSEYTTFQAALGAVNLSSYLSAAGDELKGTAFIPTDAAFAKLLAALKLTPAELLADAESVAGVLMYHLTTDFYASAEDVAAAGKVMMSNMMDVEVETTGDMVSLVFPNGTANIVGDVVLMGADGKPTASFFAIDTVLIPGPAANATSDTTATATPSASGSRNATTTTNTTTGRSPSPSPSATVTSSPTPVATGSRSSAASATVSVAAVAGALLLAAML